MSEPSTSPWERFYRTYRELECRLSGRAESRPARRIIDLLIEKPNDYAMNASLEAEVGGLEWRLKDLRLEIDALAQSLPNMIDGRRPEEYLENVYCAAYSIRRSSAWQPSPTLELVYRGQNNHIYLVRPRMFRDGGSEETLAPKRMRLRDFVRSLQRHLPDLTEAQAVAVGQHYAAEAKVETWMIDVTWDPLVALFFASDGGKTGNLGVVAQYSRAEWDNFSANGANAMGPIELVQVPDIHRIAVQRALFINTSHPEYFERLIPYSIWFKQQTGLVFHDETLDWPISKSIVYPEDDPTRSLVAGLEIVPEGVELTIAPRGNPAEPLVADNYLQMAESWLVESGESLGAEHRAVLEIACRFYYELSLRKDELDISFYSMHRLREAFDIILDREKQDKPYPRNDSLGLEDAVKFTLNRARTQETSGLLNFLVRQLAYPRAMRSLIGLIKEISPLHTVGGFGFGASQDPHGDLRRIKDSQLWTFADFRWIDAESQLTRILDLSNEKLLIIVPGERPSRPLYALIKSFIDHREHFDPGNGVIRARDKDLNLILVFPWARNYQDVPSSYHNVSYWLFEKDTFS